MPEPQISSLDLSNIGSSNVLSSFGDFFSGLLKTDNKYDFNKISGLAALAGSGAGFFDRSQQPTGYQGGIPDYRVVRNPVQNSYDPNRRPGSRGRRYFTDTRFVDMDADNQEMGGAANRLSQAKQFAESEAAGIQRAQNTIMAPVIAPTEGIASVATAAPASASSVINAMPVPTYTMASEFPAPVEEVKTMSAGGEVIAQLMANPYFVGGGLGLDAAGLAYLFKSMYGNSKGKEDKSPIVKATGGAISVQEQAKKDAEALGITIDEYYSLPFKERLGLAKKDIGEVFNPSLGPLLQNPNNVDPENARSLGILSLPKPPAPAPAPIPAPVPEITQENLPKYKPPSIQETTTANRPESLTLEDQRSINQGRMSKYPFGAGIGPEMRNEDFLSQLQGIDPESKYLPPSSDTTVPPATYQGRGAPPKPPKPKLGDFKGSLNKNDAFRKRQKERREWDKKYSDMYNDDGTLKLDNEGFLEKLLQILSGGLGGGVESGAEGLATGGMLGGATDGMADKVPAMIDNKDPAALSDGEYVITADVVSHLGNGNSDAGAKVLDGFMKDVRMARTGTKKQGKEINPQKFLPKV